MTSGGGNTFIGSDAGNVMTNGGFNTFVGLNSGSTNGNGNTLIGVFTFGGGNSNTVVGDGAGSTGNSSIAIGDGANSQGNYNAAIGSGAKVQPFTPGSPAPTFSTAIGAGVVANLDNSVFIGREIDVVRVDGVLNAGSVFSSSVTTSSL